MRARAGPITSAGPRAFWLLVDYYSRAGGPGGSDVVTDKLMRDAPRYTRARSAARVFADLGRIDKYESALKQTLW